MLMVVYTKVVYSPRVFQTSGGSVTNSSAHRRVVLNPIRLLYALLFFYLFRNIFTRTHNTTEGTYT